MGFKVVAIGRGGDIATDALAQGACRTLGVESENRPQRVHFWLRRSSRTPDLPPHSRAMGQKAGEKGAAAADSQPTIPKSDRLLGAHIHIDNREEDAVAALQRMGGAQVIVTTIDQADAVSALVAALAPEGRLVVLNPGKSPLQIAAGPLVGGQRSILGSITGTPFDNEKALHFSVLVDVRPRIETLPLEQAAVALRKLRSGDVKYRMVLTVGHPTQPQEP